MTWPSRSEGGRVDWGKIIRLPGSAEALLEVWDYKFKARSARSCDSAGTFRVRVKVQSGCWVGCNQVGVFPKAESIRRGERVWKRLSLGKEAGEPCGRWGGAGKGDGRTRSQRDHGSEVGR